MRNLCEHKDRGPVLKKFAEDFGARFVREFAHGCVAVRSPQLFSAPPLRKRFFDHEIHAKE